MTPRPERLLLLDTASLYFRAFFGVPDSMVAPDGTPINAVRGLLDFIARLSEQYQPTHLACCWDNDWRPQWRVDLIPTYKEHRVVGVRPDGRAAEEVPEALSVQVPLIAELLDALGLPVVGADGYEADDVIGTLTHQAGVPVDIVTGDRDLFQLVDDARSRRVLYTARGVGNHEQVTNDVILAKYGVRADQYADFATLRGDSSDGLPGVSGIGEKTAARLLQQFDNLAGIQDAAGDPGTNLTPAVRRRIIEGADYLSRAPQVVAVARDVPVPSWAALAVDRAPADPARLAELTTRLGVESAARRVLDAMPG